MQSPPAKAEATSVSILSPVFRPSRRAAEVKVMVDEFPAGPGAGRGWQKGAVPALATRRWSSKTMRMRSGLFGGSIYWVLLVSGRVSVPKPLSQIQRSTLCLLQGLSPRPSLGGFGLRPSEYLDFQYGKPDDETASGASPIRTRPKPYSGSANSPNQRTLSMPGLAAR